MMQAQTEPKAGDAKQFIGSSAAMQDIYRAITNLLGNDLTVTVTGEKGTGKMLLAKMLHESSQRKDGPFVVVHLSAIAPELLENHLFGSKGKCIEAMGGTLYLAEIDMLPQPVQQRLLRMLQQGEFSDGARIIKSDFRLVCATSAKLMQLLSSRQFDEELYYRLNIIPLRLPPLHKRCEDIAPLAQFFLKRAAETGLPARILEADTIAAMQNYDWPGNVRELENMMLRFCVSYPDSMISADAFQNEIKHESFSVDQKEGTLEQNVEAHLKHYFDAHSGEHLPPPGLYDRLLPLVEKPLIEMTLKATGGNQVKAAYVLGINRNTLRKKIEQLRIRVGLQ
jgi:two-component system nitrogen regulation response regulator GlnG